MQKCWIKLVLSILRTLRTPESFLVVLTIQLSVFLWLHCCAPSVY